MYVFEMLSIYFSIILSPVPSPSLPLSGVAGGIILKRLASIYSERKREKRIDGGRKGVRTG